MGLNDKFHIDPIVGKVELCRRRVGECPLGGLDHHFYNQDVAYRVYRDASQAFREWTVASVVPQEAGWVTEYVFDPARPRTYHNMHVLFGYDIPEGTRMVVENGWVFEKLSFDDFWEMKAGEERVGGIKIGQPLRYYEFLRALEQVGGRLELREGVAPMKIQWRDHVPDPEPRAPITVAPIAPRRRWWQPRG